MIAIRELIYCISSFMHLGRMFMKKEVNGTMLERLLLLTKYVFLNCRVVPEIYPILIHPD